MIRKILLLSVLTTTVLLSGCDEDKVGKLQQEYTCREHGGVGHYDNTFNFRTLQCMDGSYYHKWYETIISAEYLKARGITGEIKDD